MMSKKLCRWELAAFLTAAVIGPLLHFTYAWSGGNAVVAAFSAVNESTWEHMKLVFFPALLFGLFLRFRLGGRSGGLGLRRQKGRIMYDSAARRGDCYRRGRRRRRQGAAQHFYRRPRILWRGTGNRHVIILRMACKPVLCEPASFRTSRHAPGDIPFLIFVEPGCIREGANVIDSIRRILV